MPTVETNGVETYYEDYGEGQPIVVLHGAIADHQVWADQLQSLSDDYRVLPYDLRGHGNTGGSDDEQYTFQMYVDDLASFINKLGLENPVILGHSMGGFIGYAFADAHPETLSALITVGSTTPETFSTREQIFRIAQTRAILPLMRNERAMNALVWLQEQLLGDDSTVDQGELERLRDAHGCDPPAISASERAKIMGATRDYLASNRSYELSGTPVLMLHGENEPFTEAHGDYLETQFEDCRSAEIPDASHNAQVDNPEFIRTRIREFLANEIDREVAPAY